MILNPSIAFGNVVGEMIAQVSPQFLNIMILILTMLGMIPYLYKKAKREYKKEIRMNKKKKFGNLEIMIKDDT